MKWKMAQHSMNWSFKCFFEALISLRENIAIIEKHNYCPHLRWFLSIFLQYCKAFLGSLWIQFGEKLLKKNVFECVKSSTQKKNCHIFIGLTRNFIYWMVCRHCPKFLISKVVSVFLHRWWYVLESDEKLRHFWYT